MPRPVVLESGWVEVPFEVPGDHAGRRVDRYLAQRLHRYSRAEVQRLIDAGRVLLRDRPAKPAARVSEGDRIVVRYPRREEPEPRYSRLPVVYEDDRLLAVSKPGDLLTHPTDKVVRSAATTIVREQAGRSLRLIHRLDRETSGVLLFAKDAEAARVLVDQFTRRRVRKEYLALARGTLGFERRCVELPIGRHGGEIKIRQAVRAEGQSAATELRRLACSADVSLVHALPRTGRLHQIRVHLAALGHPVVGDKLYTGEGEAYLKAVRRQLGAGDAEALGAPRQMLHAWRLRVLHPVDERPVDIAAPPPDDFAECALRHGLSLPAA